VVWHVGQLLLHHSTTVGRVYWEYQNGDIRKPILLVLPPVAVVTSNDQEQLQQQDDDDDDDDDTGSHTTMNNNKRRKKKKKQKQYHHASAAAPQQHQPVWIHKKLRFRVQIRFAMESLAWMANPLRLLPNRCNISSTTGNGSSSSRARARQHSIQDNKQQEEEEEEEPSSKSLLGDTTSVAYNHAMSEDVVLSHHFSMMQHNRMGDIDHDKDQHLNDAVVLLVSVWSLQRGLLRNHDGWDTFCIQHLVLYLFRSKQANARMTALQIVTALFKCVAETNWLGEETNTKGGNGNDDNRIRRAAPSEAYVSWAQDPSAKRTVLILPPHEAWTVQQTVAQSDLANRYAEQTRMSPVTSNKDQDDTDPPTLLELYQSCRHYLLGPVFLDPTYNYMGRLSPSFMRLLQAVAVKSLDCLHSYSVSSKPFHYLFRPPHGFDDVAPTCTSRCRC
jgi:hypothetical protein